MKRSIFAAILVALTAGMSFAQATARQENLVQDVRRSSSLTVNHKAYSAIQFDGTVTDSVEQAAIDISGKTGTLGFKKNLSDTAFFAEVAITISDGPAGLWTATIPAAQWATNVTVKTRYYGDLRLSDFGNTLPSIDLWLYPSANSGSESNYNAPTLAGWETNSVEATPITIIDFRTGFTFVYEGGTMRVDTISIPESNLITRVEFQDSNAVHRAAQVANRVAMLASNAASRAEMLSTNAAERAETLASNAVIQAEMDANRAEMLATNLASRAEMLATNTADRAEMLATNLANRAEGLDSNAVIQTEMDIRQGRNASLMIIDMEDNAPIWSAQPFNTNAIVLRAFVRSWDSTTGMVTLWRVGEAESEDNRVMMATNIVLDYDGTEVTVFDNNVVSNKQLIGLSYSALDDASLSTNKAITVWELVPQ